MNQEQMHHPQHGHYQQPPQQPQQTPQQREDRAAMQFLAMAEHFRTAEFPSCKAAAKCLMAATKTNASPYLKAHVHYQLGKFLYMYTRNTSKAKSELETAHSMFKSMGPQCEEIRLQCATLIAECALSVQETECIITLLQAEAQFTRKYPKLHGKALMLTIEALSAMDPKVALEVVNMGLLYFKDLKDNVMECYFQLVKCLLYSRQAGTLDALGKAVTELSDMLNVVQAVPNINDMRAFCYAIQLTYFLSVGMIRQSKRCLRELQVIVQNKGRNEEQIAAATKSETTSFSWLKKELLTGLTYGLTALWSIQSGQFDKAERYFTNSVGHLGELTGMMHKAKWGVIQRGHERFIAHLHFAIHEGMAHMYIARGRPDKVGSMTNQMIRALRAAPRDSAMFEPQAHVVMGLYFNYMKDTAQAESQLLVAIKTTKEPELKVFAKLSLSLMYLFQGREKDFYDHYDSVRPNKLHNVSSIIKAMAHFVGAVHTFVHGRFSESKASAIEAVNICQDKDIIRVQALSMLLIGKMFNGKDSDAVSAAHDWAVKTSDPHLLSWAKLMLADYAENRAREEKNYAFMEEAKQHRESARCTQVELAQHVTAAAEVPLQKYATMVDYSEELGRSQWNGIY